MRRQLVGAACWVVNLPIRRGSLLRKNPVMSRQPEARPGNGCPFPTRRVSGAHEPRTADAAKRDRRLLRPPWRAVRRTPAAPLPAVCGQYPGGRRPSAWAIRELGSALTNHQVASTENPAEARHPTWPSRLRFSSPASLRFFPRGRRRWAVMPEMRSGPRHSAQGRRNRL